MNDYGAVQECELDRESRLSSVYCGVRSHSGHSTGVLYLWGVTQYGVIVRMYAHIDHLMNWTIIWVRGSYFVF